MSSKSGRRRWLIPLAIGISIPLGAILLPRLISPPVQPAKAKVARLFGMEPTVYDSLTRMIEELGAGSDLSPNEWALVKQTLKDPNPNAQTEAVRVMEDMRRSSYRSEALVLVRPFLTGNNLGAEVAALHVLNKLDDPTWREEVVARAKRPEESIQAAVKAILARKASKT